MPTSSRIPPGKLPTDFNPGDPVKAKDINEIQRHVNARGVWNITPDNGEIDIQPADGNTGFDWSGLDDRISAIEVASGLSPWKPYNIPGTELIAVKAGSIYRGASLNSTVGLSGFASTWPPISSDENAFTCPAIGNFAWIEITTSVGGVFDPSMSGGGELKHDSGTWTGAPVQVAANTDDPSNPYQTFFYLPVLLVVGPTDVRASFVVGTGGSARGVVQLLDQDVSMADVFDSALPTVQPAGNCFKWNPFGG